MSAINQMLRDLDKRNALAQGSTPAAAPAGPAAPNRLASAYASVRLIGPRTRPSRAVLLAAGAAALLPIAWATTAFDLPAMAVQATPTQAVALAAPVRVATAPMAPPAATAAPAPAETMVVAVPATAPTTAPVAATGPATTSAPAATTTPPAPVADATVVLAAAPVAPRVVPVSTAAAVPVTRVEASPVFPPPAAAPPPTRSRLVRAPVLTVPNGEGAVAATLPASPAPASAAPASLTAPTPTAPRLAPANRDTRLALAPPTVPKAEARIERHPTDARDDLVRAGEAMSIGRTSDAIALLRKVILAEPDNERARLALLSLLAERGRDDSWRAALADSAKALPKRFGLAAAQGMAESGRFEESLAILRGLPESVRDTRYFAALGATHQQLNQHAEAVAAFDAALGKAAGGSPQLPSLLVAQALSMQSLGKTNEARGNLERVRQMPEAAAEVRDFAVRELAHSR